MYIISLARDEVGLTLGQPTDRNDRGTNKERLRSTEVMPQCAAAAQCRQVRHHHKSLGACTSAHAGLGGR